MTADPFAVLGLPARADLSNADVRAAWRAIAAATHPDRPGGGDAARYAAASAAYAALRTAWGRSEAYADLTAGRIPPPVPRLRARFWPTGRGLPSPGALVVLPARIRHGRAVRLALRLLAAGLAAALTIISGAGTPAIAAVPAGIGVWLVLTSRGDLAPPPGR